MRIFHEAPLCIFDQVQEVTDGDYFLVHLFEENKAYWQKAKEAVKKGRYVILDNSVFELEEAFDSDRFLYWINRLQPTEYIIPDVLEDSHATIKRLNEWIIKYQPKVTTGSKSIGVVQGKTFDDIVECYRCIEPYVDKVAISFDYSFMCPVQVSDSALRCELFMLGRRSLIEKLVRYKVINELKPHHLLGCTLPIEFAAYKGYKWIDSLDTSNPVVAGINNQRYDEYGLKIKNKTKLIEYMDCELTQSQIEDVIYNIGVFREFCV